MLVPWKKSYEQPRKHIKKQRHLFANKGPYNQSYGFSCSHVWMEALEHKESWALKNWCFWTVALERLLRVPWTTRRSNQSILKEINTEYSFEGLMLKLKLQYFGHLMQKASSLEKTLMLGKIQGRRRKGWQKKRWYHDLLVMVLDGITYSMNISLSKLMSWWWTGRPGMLQYMGSQRVRHNWVTELNWRYSGMRNKGYPYDSYRFLETSKWLILTFVYFSIPSNKWQYVHLFYFISSWNKFFSLNHRILD